MIMILIVRLKNMEGIVFWLIRVVSWIILMFKRLNLKNIVAKKNLKKKKMKKWKKILMRILDLWKENQQGLVNLILFQNLILKIKMTLYFQMMMIMMMNMMMISMIKLIKIYFFLKFNNLNYFNEIF